MMNVGVGALDGGGDPSIMLLYFDHICPVLHVTLHVACVLYPSPSTTEEVSCEFGSSKYYALCGFGGILSCGITHTAVVPLDLVKCRLQVCMEAEPSADLIMWPESPQMGQNFTQHWFWLFYATFTLQVLILISDSVFINFLLYGQWPYNLQSTALNMWWHPMQKIQIIRDEIQRLDSVDCFTSPNKDDKITFCECLVQYLFCDYSGAECHLWSNWKQKQKQGSKIELFAPVHLMQGVEQSTVIMLDWFITGQGDFLFPPCPQCDRKYIFFVTPLKKIRSHLWLNWFHSRALSLNVIMLVGIRFNVVLYSCWNHMFVSGYLGHFCLQCELNLRDALVSMIPLES